MKKLLAFLLVFTLAFVFIGCGEETEDILPTSVEIKATEKTVFVGETINLSATIKPTDATNKQITWESSDASIATVKNGAVTGVAVGTVTIKAISKALETVFGTIEISVIEKQEILPETITLSGDTSLVSGRTGKMYASIKPTDATEKEVIWTSSDEAVVTVDQTGKLTAIGKGVATITATSAKKQEVFGTKDVTVIDESEMIEIQGLTITNYGEKKLYTYETLNLNVSFAPVDATIKKVVWSVNDETIATIDEDGIITPLKAGIITVTVTAADKETSTVNATMDIEIIEPVTPTSFVATTTVDDKGIKFGRTTQIGIIVEPSNGDKRATYTSSNEAVATVNELGVVTAVAVGEVEITATSTANPSLSSKVTIKVNDGTVDNKPTKIEIKGEAKVFEGYKITLTASVMPISASQNVIWTSKTTDTGTVDQNGVVTAIKKGTIRIECASEVDPTVKATFRITCEVEPTPPPIPNLGGYEIIIMNAESALSDNDPFLEGYNNSDKSYKQKAWRDVEEAYNCKIKVVKYPDTAPWGEARINWIIDNASANTSQCDLGVISSNWIHRFGQASAAADVTTFYNKYGKSQMEPALNEVGTYRQKLHIASTGLSSTATYVDLGLFYNLAWVEKLGVDDPATLFMNDQWNYTGFINWCKTVQSKLGESEYALAGHPYYFWFGMSNAAGVKIADTRIVETNVSDPKSKDAIKVIADLNIDGCLHPDYTWAETDGGFIDGTAVMSTGYLWFIRNTGRWTADLWGEDTRFGYVPFPYPDSMRKEDCKIAVTGLSVLLYTAGHQYPTGVTLEGIYRAVNDMFLNTIKYQEADPLFNSQEIKYNSLTSRLDNAKSIDCVLFFDAKRTFFDACHAFYGSVSATPIKTPCVNVVRNNADYDQEFDAVYNAYDTEFKKIYS